MTAPLGPSSEPLDRLSKAAERSFVEAVRARRCKDALGVRYALAYATCCELAALRSAVLTLGDILAHVVARQRQAEQHGGPRPGG